MPSHTKAEQALRKMKAKKKAKGKKGFLLHAGGDPESMGSGRYAKDILKVGAYVHPATGQIIDITPERIRMHAKEAARYLANGNEIFYPDGHTTEASKNMGDWPGPFFEHEDTLTGVLVPKSEAAIRGNADKTMNRVSAYIDFDVTDPKGNHYAEVITHICATPMPVITGQKDPVQLSRDLDAGGPPVYLFQGQKLIKNPEGLAAALGDLADVCRGGKKNTVAGALGELSKLLK